MNSSWLIQPPCRYHAQKLKFVVHKMSMARLVDFLQAQFKSEYELSRGGNMNRSKSFSSDLNNRENKKHRNRFDSLRTSIKIKISRGAAGNYRDGVGACRPVQNTRLFQ